MNILVFLPSAPVFTFSNVSKLNKDSCPAYFPKTKAKSLYVESTTIFKSIDTLFESLNLYMPTLILLAPILLEFSLTKFSIISFDSSS